jgi:hypothetical protein
MRNFYMLVAVGWGLLGPLLLARYGSRPFAALTLCLMAIAHSIHEIPLLSLGAPASMLVRNVLPTSLLDLYAFVVATVAYGVPFWTSSLAALLLRRSGRPTWVQCVVGATVAVLMSLAAGWIVIGMLLVFLAPFG